MSATRVGLRGRSEEPPLFVLMEKQNVDVEKTQRNLLLGIQQSKGTCGCGWWYPRITEDWDGVALVRRAFKEQMQFAS